MKTKIQVTESEDKFSLSYAGQSESYNLLNSSGHYVTSFTEKELIELKKMIDEIIQLVNKRDW